MKKMAALLMACAMGLSLTACGSKEAPETTAAAAAAAETKSAGTEASTEETAVEMAADESSAGEASTELIVFAAASMTETLTEIGKLYEAENPDIKLIFNFESSGTLKTQIQEGSECDVFISAGQKQMNQLDITADETVNTDKLDFVLEGTRFNILENKVTLCVSDGCEIASFDELAEALKNGEVLMAMGNQDVPVGQYTQKILKFYELNEEELAAAGKISYGSNVKEVTTQITEGSVDCGVIYCTDAFSAGLNIKDYATAQMCGQVIYPAAVLNVSEHPEEAKAFLEYLKTEPCMEIFAGVGFSAAE